MKKAKTIEGKGKAGCRRLALAFRALKKSYDEEAIHDFRVEVKKLRALFRLRSSCPGAKELHLHPSVRKYSNALGEVRCFQLQQQAVLQFCQRRKQALPAQYLTLLQQLEVLAQWQATVVAKAVSIKQTKRRLKISGAVFCQQACVENFVARKKHELLKFLLLPIRADEDLHQLRKILKDLLYTWPLIKETVNDFFPDGVLTRECCDIFSEKLGEFQDLCTSLRCLQPAAISLSVNKDEAGVLQAMRLSCEDQKRRLRTEIENMLSFWQSEWEREDLLLQLYDCL